MCNTTKGKLGNCTMKVKDILNNEGKYHVHGRQNSTPYTLCGPIESSAITAPRSEQLGLLKCVTLGIPPTSPNLSFLTYERGIAILPSC